MYYIKMYSTYNEGKSVVAEKFIRTLKNKIHKYMTAVSYHTTIRTKPIDVKSDSYAEYSVDSNEKDPTFKVCDL